MEDPFGKVLYPLFNEIVYEFYKEINSPGKLLGQ